MTKKQAMLVAVTIGVTGVGWVVMTAQPTIRSGEWLRAPSSRWSTTAPSGAEQTPTPARASRVVAARGGMPILENLRPDDTDVEVVRTQHFLVEGFDDPQEELEFLTRHSAAVVTVQAGAIASELTPERDWIVSVLTATVTDVLKNASNIPLSEGATLQLPFEGGELSVNGKRLRATSTPIKYPVSGRRYLYFLLESDGRLAPMPPVHTFELSGTTIERLYGDGEWGLDRGIAQDVVLNSIRSMASLPTVRAPRRPR